MCPSGRTSVQETEEELKEHARRLDEQIGVAEVDAKSTLEDVERVGKEARQSRLARGAGGGKARMADAAWAARREWEELWKEYD